MVCRPGALIQVTVIYLRPGTVKRICRVSMPLPGRSPVWQCGVIRTLTSVVQEPPGSPELPRCLEAKYLRTKP